MNSTKVVSQLQVSSSILIVYLKVNTSKIKLKEMDFLSKNTNTAPTPGSSLKGRALVKMKKKF